MKKIAVVLLTIIFAAGCSSTKKTATSNDKAGSTISFEYEAMTRGSYKKVVVTKDSIVTIKDHTMKDIVSKPTKKGDWDYLVSTTAKTNLEGLQNLKAPSTKSHADAALAANLKVIKDGKTYSTPTFDHGNPPAEISGVVSRIVLISDLQKK